MPEILQDWLGTSLGVILDMSPEKFGRNTKDGTFLAKVLYNYGVIPQHVHDQVKESKNFYECHRNLILLKPWLSYINVTPDDSALEAMARGEGSAAISVFYAVYLNLERKDRLHYLSAQKERRFSEDSCSRKFKVDWVPEAQVLNNPMEPPSKLQTPLLEKRDMIEWHKSKCREIVETIRKTKEKFRKSTKPRKKDLGPLTSKHPTSQILDKRMLEAEETKEKINTFEKKHPYKCQNLGYSELMELKTMVDSQPCVQVPNQSEAKITIENIKRRKKGEVYARNFQQKMEHLVLDEYWNGIVEKQNKDFENTVCGNLLKQSQYEKQMANKLFMIRNQKKVLAENRKRIECLKMVQKEKEFDDFLNAKMEMRGEDWEDEEFEKERLVELHRRMYDEKVRRRREIIRAESRKICETLVDIAIRISEIRDLTLCQVPKAFMKDMKELFFKDLSIFDFLDNFEEIYEKDSSLSIMGEDMEEEGVFYNFDYEKLKCAERQRQNILDECDLNDYINLLGPWMIELYFPDGSETEVKHIVLGYIVHKLLGVKYPCPSTPAPVDIKPMKPVAVVQGLVDENACNMFLDLMEACKVLVVRVENAINFVLAAYKEELSVVRDIDVNFQKVTANAQKDKALIEKDKEVKKKVLLLKKESSEELIEEKPEFLDKETQTPRMIPEEDPLLSQNAEIGKMAFEALGAGDPVPDTVIISAVIAYVAAKQDEYDGWVLLNYPVFYSQASELEYHLTGYRTLPILEEMDSMEEAEGFTYRGPWGGPLTRDDFAENRLSRLVPQPDVFLVAPVDVPKTYFDLFIKINKSTEPSRLWSQDFDGVSPLDKFYSDLETLVNFEYQNLTFQTMKDLGKVVLGKTTEDDEVGLAPKTSLEIFGNAVLELNEKWNPVKKKVGKDKESPGLLKKAIKEPVVEIIFEPEKEEVEEVEEESEEQKVTEVSSPKPGDAEWEWANGPQPESIQVALASLWENMEAVYVEDFKGVFFSLRVHRCNVYSYSASIKNFMRTLTTRPDDKQRILSDFQHMFNEIDVDLRPDVDVKCELHVRVSELEQALMSLADERKKEFQKDLKNLAEDGWVAGEMASLVNTFLTALQLEADRCIDSCQVIMDYYLTLQQRVPDEKPLSKVTVAKLQMKDKKFSIDSSIPNKSGSNVFSTPRNSDLKRANKSFAESSGRISKTRSLTDKRRRSTDSGFLEGAAEVITEILVNLCLPEGGMTPFHNFFFENVQLITNEVKTTAESCISEAKKGDKTVVKNQKKGSDTKILVSGNVNAEWLTALENELSRFLFRTKLILARGIFEMNEFLTTILNIISSLSEYITEVYLREINSISECCKVFRCGIEEEIRIQPQLELLGCEFMVDDNVLLFEDERVEEEQFDDEQQHLGFTIEQLSILCQKLQRVAPNGEIIRRSLIYILEDLRVLRGEVENISIFPEIWRMMNPSDLNTIMCETFNDLEIVHWKDFIIYAMELPVPTDLDILSMRDAFRKFDPNVTELISRNDYDDVPFWFDKNLGHFSQADREENAKDLLYKMYQVDEDQTNYSALLLALCKDEDPVHGFLKALTLAMGKRISIDEIEGEVLSFPGEDGGFDYGTSDVYVQENVKKTHCCPSISTEVTRKCIPKEKMISCQCRDFEKSLDSEGSTELEDVDYGNNGGEESTFYYGSQIMSSSSVPVVPFGILSPLLRASFPSLPQISILLDCKQTFQETLNSVYDSLEPRGDSVEVYKLVKHKFIDQLLHRTNKFKYLSIRQIVIRLMNYRNSMGGKICLPDKLNVNYCLN